MTENVVLHPVSAQKPSTLMYQMSIIHMQSSDMATHLKAIMKRIIDENTALKKENADLKAKANN
jgi:hypothetical protein